MTQRLSFPTSLGAAYTVSKYEFVVPPSPPCARPFLPKPLLPESSSSLSDFRFQLSAWKRRCLSVPDIPVPLGHLLPRPRPPQIISSDEWADAASRRRLIRLFLPESSPLSPTNDLFCLELLASDAPFDLSCNFPEPGLNSDSIPLSNHIYDLPPWSSQLLAARPLPALFATFADYELALMAWTKDVMTLPILPPSASDVGAIVPLVRESDSGFAPPPPPDEPPVVVRPITSTPATVSSLLDLRSSYESFLMAKPSGATPPPAVSQACEFGFPLDVTSRPTLILRANRLLSSNGLLMHPVFQMPGSSRSDSNLLLSDFSIDEFSELLDRPSPLHGTVGNDLLEMHRFDDLLSLSFMTSEPRFCARFSLLMRRLLRVSVMVKQVLGLDLVRLERFVSLVIFPQELCAIPECDIDAACDESAEGESEVDLLSGITRQVHCLGALYHFVVCSRESSGCLPFVRGLLHRACGRVTEFVRTTTRFSRILNGFFSFSERTHRFYFCVLRTIIGLEYTATLRELGHSQWFTFFEKGFISEAPHVRRSSLSLFQLFLHTSSSIVLRHEMNVASARAIVNAPGQYLYACLQLFRRFQMSSDFAPMEFRQYNALFEVLSSDLGNEANLNFLCVLIKFCQDADCVFCARRSDLQDLIGRFAQSKAAQLLQNVTATKLRCLKTLFKIPFLELGVVANVEVWGAILGEMGARNSAQAVREEAWKTFRNGVVTYPKLSGLLFGTPELARLTIGCFGSMDEGVASCMVRTLPRLSRPNVRQSLGDLWKGLADPAVLIAGKIRMMHKAASGKVRVAIVEFVFNVLMAPTQSPLVSFIRTPHIWSELKEVVLEIAALCDLPVTWRRD
jgi:hypothetical protein